MKAPAIPFIRHGKAAPPRTEETLYGALKPAFRGLTKVSLTAEGGTEFYGTNIQLRDCTISAGVHPAIKAKAASPGVDPHVTLLLCHFGTAEFSYSPTEKLTLRPRRAGLLRNRDWEADCSDYGGLVMRLPRSAMAQSLSLALDQEVSADDVDTYDLRPDAASCLRHSLQSLDIAYRPQLARSGLFDDHLVAAAALCIEPAARASASQHDRFRHVVDRACRIIRKDLRSALTVAELARVLNVSERYLQIAFQALHGMGPKQWMLQGRLSAARQDMLSNPAIGLSRLSEDYQFSSPAHFSRAFRKAFGMNPSRIRRGGEA
jgi:AraC-like DNA-binding protein